MTKIAKRPELIAVAVTRSEMGERLVAFAKTYSLSRAGLAIIFGTPEQTVGNWLKDRVLPPACSIKFLDVLEQSDEARQIAGVYRWRVKQEVVKKESSRKPRRRPDSAFVLSAGPEFFDPDLFVEGPVPEGRVVKD
jgi:DNA-binding transcriptional regulator YiaG